MLAVVRPIVVVAGLLVLAACNSGSTTVPQAAPAILPPPGVTPMPTSSPVAGPKATATITFTLPTTAQDAEIASHTKVSPAGYFPPFTGSQRATSIDVYATTVTPPFVQTYQLANQCNAGPPVTCTISTAIPVGSGSGTISVGFYNDGGPRRLLAGGTSAPTTFTAGANPSLTISSGRFASSLSLAPTTATVAINAVPSATTASYTLALVDAFGSPISSGTPLSNPITFNTSPGGTVGVGSCGATAATVLTAATTAALTVCPNLTVGSSAAVVASSQPFLTSAPVPVTSTITNVPEHHIYSISVNGGTGNVLTASSFAITNPGNWIAASPPSIAAPLNGSGVYLGSIFNGSYNYYAITGITPTGGGSPSAGQPVSSTFGTATGTRVFCQIFCVGFALQSNNAVVMETLTGLSASQIASQSVGNASFQGYASSATSVGAAVGVVGTGALGYKAGGGGTGSGALTATILATDSYGPTPYVATSGGGLVTTTVFTLTNFLSGASSATITSGANVSALFADPFRHLLFVGRTDGGIECYNMTNPAVPVLNYSISGTALSATNPIVAMTSFGQFDLVYAAQSSALAVFQATTGKILRAMTSGIPSNPGIAAAY